MRADAFCGAALQEHKATRKNGNMADWNISSVSLSTELKNQAMIVIIFGGMQGSSGLALVCILGARISDQQGTKYCQRSRHSSETHVLYERDKCGIIKMERSKVFRHAAISLTGSV